MALFKQQIVRYVNASGKRVSKSTPGARRVQERSRKYYGEFADEHGVTKRVPLARDKAAAQTMLNDLIKQVERKQAGLHDPFEEHRKKPLAGHLEDYKRSLLAKGDTEKHAKQSVNRVQRLCDECGITRLQHFDLTKVETWLDTQQSTKSRFSAQTRNHYGNTVVYFLNWCVQRQRIAANPLLLLKPVNVEVDRRHERRSLSEEEFVRVVNAAEAGKRLQRVPGPERAMIYVLAAWTGFRRGELASLTLGSFDFDSKPAVIRLKAGSSKRRKKDALPLHPLVVERFMAWLELRGSVTRSEPLFRLKMPSGTLRRTADMMRHDLEVARAAWIEEADSEQMRAERVASDFLTYQDADGLIADFHAHRHVFISNLAKAGVTLATAQKLARHSDPRLTSNVYTHLELADQQEAIESLPKPPAAASTKGDVRGESRVTSMVTRADVVPCHQSAQVDAELCSKPPANTEQKTLPRQGLGSTCQCVAPSGTTLPTSSDRSSFGVDDRCGFKHIPRHAFSRFRRAIDRKTSVGAAAQG